LKSRTPLFLFVSENTQSTYLDCNNSKRERFRENLRSYKEHIHFDAYDL
jgi:hypothetical protein